MVLLRSAFNIRNNFFRGMNGKFFLGLCIVLVPFFSCSSDEREEGNTIPFEQKRTYVPDDVFEKHLITIGYDNDMDDSAATAAVALIRVLEISATGKPSESKIKTLQGLQDFTALEHLDVSDNLIESIDVTHSPELSFVRLNGNNITSLNLSKNSELKILELNGNKISSIDLSNNKKLESLKINSNPIESLDLRDLPVLNRVEAVESSLITIDVSGTPIKEIYVWKNSLRNLLIQNNPKLEAVFAHNNLLSSIDVGGAPGIRHLYLDNNDLNSLDITSFLPEFHLKVRDNPDLRCVKVSRKQLEGSVVDKDEHVELSPYCAG